MMHVSVSVAVSYYNIFFFCKQNTAYEVRISDCSSDVCSPDLRDAPAARAAAETLPVSDNAVRKAARRRDVQRCTAMRASFGSGRNRSEVRRGGKECAGRVGLGGRSLLNKNNTRKRFASLFLNIFSMASLIYPYSPYHTP